MQSKRSTLTISVTIVAFLVATVVTQPLLLLPGAAAQGEEEGGGRTTLREKIDRVDNTNFTSAGTFNKDDLESAAAISADTVSPVPACPLPGGLDHAAAGTGLRNSGWGAVRLRGVPAGSVLVRAILYWGIIVTNPAPATMTVSFEGHQIAGNLIGTATEPCWFIPNTTFAAYTANVQQFVPAVINGDYQVDGFPTSIVDGSDPWPRCTAPFFFPPAPLAEGASLVVIYSNRNIPNGARVYIHHGPAFFAGALNITHNLNPTLPAHTFLKHTRIGADGQVGCSVNSMGFMTGERTSIGPNLATLTQIKGPGSPLNSDSDWNGYDGVPLNQLWDTHTDAFDREVNGVDPIPAGAASYVVQYVSQGDCIDTVVHILSVR